MSFQGKTIYITGGSTGIGLAMAQLLAKEGAKLALFARNEGKLNAAKQSIGTASTVQVYPVDACSYNDVEAAFGKAKADIGAPDILINCVGRAVPDHFESIPATQMEETMRTNFGSVWNACQAGVKLMKNKGGKIVNTSSIGGFIGVFGYTDYSASKFAIIGFSEALGQELKKYNIKVQVLCPPDTETPGFETENLTKPEETKLISGNAKLMTAGQVAKSAITGIKGKTFMIIPGFDGKLTYFMKRHFPEVVDWMMARSLKGK
jgi:short-subunit dehydrogenase